MVRLENPYRPGAGHQPPHLAGRDAVIAMFRQLLSQRTILENLILTGLRGVGKTVLLDRLKPVALPEGWVWVGADMSQATSVSEDRMVTRLLTDFSVVTSALTITEKREAGFFGEAKRRSVNYEALLELYNTIPGLPSDKLKGVLERVWEAIPQSHRPKGFVFAYDEAQNLSDNPQKEEYPLSLLLEVFQSIQKKDLPFMLVLAGLPTLFPKLVESRTFSERMFHVEFLDRLSEKHSREAITEPLKDKPYLTLSPESIKTIIKESGGYPYFIQFICKETFDVLIQKIDSGETPSVPIESIILKLDDDFFSGRWARATDRQRDLLWAIAHLETADSQFTVQEAVARSRQLLQKPFSNSHANQMLSKLSDAGLVFKNRHGKYSFAVPLFGEFILRQRPPGEVT